MGSARRQAGSGQAGSAERDRGLATAGGMEATRLSNLSPIWQHRHSGASGHRSVSLAGVGHARSHTVSVRQRCLRL